MNEVIIPRRPGDTNEGMEKEFIHLFRKLSYYNQLTILGAMEGKLDNQAEAAAKANHLHLVKIPAFPPKKGKVQSRQG